MYQKFLYSIIACFALFAITNIVIRFTVFKMYSELRRKGVEISGKSFFNAALLEKEVKEKYQDDADLIFRFVKYTKFAMTFASILITFIMIMGYILLKMK